jgi:hypothetical protein
MHCRVSRTSELVGMYLIRVHEEVAGAELHARAAAPFFCVGPAAHFYCFCQGEGVYRCGGGGGRGQVKQRRASASWRCVPTIRRCPPRGEPSQTA